MRVPKVDNRDTVKLSCKRFKNLLVEICQFKSTTTCSPMPEDQSGSYILVSVKLYMNFCYRGSTTYNSVISFVRLITIQF